MNEVPIMEHSGTAVARILIVDDEPEILTEYSAILSPVPRTGGNFQGLAALEHELFGHETQERDVPDLDVTPCKQGDEAVEEAGYRRQTLIVSLIPSSPRKRLARAAALLSRWFMALPTNRAVT